MGKWVWALAVLVCLDARLAGAASSSGDDASSATTDTGSLAAAEEGNSVIDIEAPQSEAPDVSEYFTKTHTLPGEDYREPIEEYQGMVGNVGSKVHLGPVVISTDVAMNAPSQALLATMTKKGPSALKHKTDPNIAGSRFVYPQLLEEPLAQISMPEPHAKDHDYVKSRLVGTVQDTHDVSEQQEKAKRALLMRISQLENELAKVDGPSTPLLTKTLTHSIIYGAHAVAASQDGEMHKNVTESLAHAAEDVHALHEDAGDHMKVETIDG